MRSWPHAPARQASGTGAFMVTAGTYQKQPFLNSPEKLSLVADRLMSFAEEFGWRLQAWAVLSNHYHFVALSPEEGGDLSRLLSKLHTLTARDLNRLDDMPGRKV